MTLIDDIQGEAAEDKQFIVVQSRGGHYFYIIIDNAAEGNNTVHFLNQIDEADLLSIIEDGDGQTEPPAACSCTDKCIAGSVNTACPVCSVNMGECTGVEAGPEQQTGQPEEAKGGMGGILLAVLLLAGAGGAFYYFKFVKPKRDAAKGSTDLDDYDFDDEDEETEEVETEQEDEDE